MVVITQGEGAVLLASRGRGRSATKTACGAQNSPYSKESPVPKRQQCRDSENLIWTLVVTVGQKMRLKIK